MIAHYQPDLEIKKAHDVRRLEGCGCGGIGMRPQMVKIDGKWWHGRCAVAQFGFDRVAQEDTGGIRLSDVGVETMKKLVDRLDRNAR